MPEKILLVDDDNEFVCEFKDCFSEYDIIAAHTAKAALEILKRPNEIDLVVLDVVLPDLRGTEVLREIKKNYPGLGIIILTGFSSEDTAIEALKGHADDYIEKPFNIERAKAIFRGVLDSKNGAHKTNKVNGISKIERIKNFIQRNPGKKFSLKDAADIACLSPKYLSRRFKKDAGINFLEYKLKIKIKSAKDFLAKSSYNINQVSDKLGYKNTESFIRQFKKYTGLTPRQYRMAHTKSKIKVNIGKRR